MHVAVIGTGRIGQMTLILLVHESWIKKTNFGGYKAMPC